ncbi:MAG: hypothetical protein P4M09_22815 [Devosia sp.]|nr:hypothetical protein [Devosia sp.]
MPKYLLNVLIALDQLLNALTGGDPDETISSRCAKRRTQPGWNILAAILEWIDPGHLDRVLEPDEGRDAVLIY